jgi:hypothetical protein
LECIKCSWMLLLNRVQLGPFTEESFKMVLPLLGRHIRV